MPLSDTTLASGGSFGMHFWIDSVDGKLVEKVGLCDVNGTFFTPLKIGDGVTSLSSGSITNPTSTLTRPANATAYAAGDVIASSITNTSIVVPSFAIATSAGGAVLSSLRLWTSATTGWDNATLLVQLWKAAPTYTNGDNGVYAVATGSAGWLGQFLFTLKQFGDGAIGRTQLSDANSMAFKLAAGTAVFWDIQIQLAATPTSGQTFILTAEPLN